MNTLPRILLVCSLATSLLSGCSGGGGSGSVPRPSASGQSVNITLDRSQLASSSASKRNAKFVGSDADDVNYAFSPSFNGSSADVSLTNCPNNTCTITIGSVPVGTYTLTLTLKHGGANGTVIGQGVTSGFSVAPGAANNVAITIAPVLTGTSAGPTISIPANSVFYADGTTTSQTVVATVNEVDPEGAAVCGTSVPNWPTLTVSGTAVSGLTGLPQTISSPPPCSSNGSTVTIAYNGNASPAVTNAAVQVSDGQQGNATPSVSIPFVGLAVSSTDSAFTSGTSSLQISGSTSNSHAITITETNGFSAGETGFTASSSCNGIVDVASDTFNAGTAASPNSTQTLRLVGHLKSSSGCTLTIASNKHPALSTSVSVNLNSTYALFDDATLLSENPTAVQASWLSSTTNPDGGVEFGIAAGLTVANLNTLSTDYLFTAGTCAGGAPRFAIDDGGKYIFAYLGPQFPVTSGVCAGSTYSNSGNLISPTSPVDATQISPGYYPTWSAFQAAHGSDVVTDILLVVDGFAPESPITARFKNTNINGQIFGY